MTHTKHSRRIVIAMVSLLACLLLFASPAKASQVTEDGLSLENEIDISERNATEISAELTPEEEDFPDQDLAAPDPDISGNDTFADDEDRSPAESTLDRQDSQTGSPDPALTENSEENLAAEIAPEEENLLPDTETAAGEAFLPDTEPAAEEAFSQEPETAAAEPLSSQTIPETVRSLAAGTVPQAEPPKIILPLSKGTYVIVSKINGFQALQPEGSSKAAGKQVELQACNGSDAQKFVLTPDEKTGYYTIQNLLSGKVLAVQGNTGTDGANVVQSTAGNALGQKWTLVEKDGYYMIQSALDGTPLALTLQGASAANGTDAIVTEAKETAVQLFRFLVSKPSVTVSSGVYTISPSTNSSMGFDISGGTTDDRGNVQLYTLNGSNNQRFIVTKISGDKYSICSYKSGKALDVKGGSVKSGANLQTFTRSGCPSQEFYIRNVGDGTLYITGVKSGLSISMKDGKTTKNTNLQMETPTGANGQKFSLKKASKSEISPIADGVYLIHSKAASNLVLGIEDASRKMSASLQLQTSHSSSFQKFKITNLYNGYYSITSVRSKHNIEVKGGSYNNKADVQQYQAHSGQAQQWLLHKNADGSITIINAKTSKAMDITGNSQKDAANIQQYAYNPSTNAQKFTFTKSSGSDNTAIDYSKANVNATLSAMMKKAQNYSKGTGSYLILVNKTAHRVVTFKQLEGRWIVERNSACCVGKSSTPTPEGVFSIYTRYYNFHGDYNDARLTYTCYYALPFYGPYYFHTILYNYGTWTVRDGRMNQDVSHGCVRMPTEEVKWLYDRYYSGVYGSKVVVYH